VGSVKLFDEYGDGYRPSTSAYLLITADDAIAAATAADDADDEA